MTSWLQKSLSSLLFRTVQRCVQALPSRLLRIRPFGVYQIRLKEVRLEEVRLGPKTNDPKQEVSGSPYQVRWVACAAEADRLSELATAENIAAWNGTTRRAVAIWQKERPLGVAWVAAERFAEDELGLRYQLADDEVWLFAAVVAPDFRRQGLYKQLLEFLIERIASTETNRILLGISQGNSPSQKAHLQYGAKQVGTIFAAKSLGLVVCKVGGQVLRISKQGWAWRRDVEVAVDQG